MDDSADIRGILHTSKINERITRKSGKDPASNLTIRYHFRSSWHSREMPLCTRDWSKSDVIFLSANFLRESQEREKREGKDLFGSRTRTRVYSREQFLRLKNIVTLRGVMSLAKLHHIVEKRFAREIACITMRESTCNARLARVVTWNI